MNYWHVPVLLTEVIKQLDLKPGDNIIDCTFGGGGYSFAVAEKVVPEGRVISIDLDEIAIKNGETKIKENKTKNITLVHDNFKNLQNIIEEYWPAGKGNFAGILFDLGLSSAQLEDRDRGFTFKVDAPLDMSFGHVEDMTKTSDIVNKYSEKELVGILRNFGEEQFATGITKAIIAARKNNWIETTAQLVEVISHAVPGSYKNRKIHFATKTFQALRIATNDELGNIRDALPQTLSLLKSGGKIIVISYHSLEDRIVKNFFKQESRGCICPTEYPLCQCDHQAAIKILTRKPIIPDALEVKENPRSRSAKLRVAEKI